MRALPNLTGPLGRLHEPFEPTGRRRQAPDMLTSHAGSETHATGLARFSAARASSAALRAAAAKSSPRLA